MAPVQSRHLLNSTQFRLSAAGACADYSSKIRGGDTAAELTLWASETCVVVRVSGGHAHSKLASITLAVQVGTVSAILSYDLLQLGSL